LNTTATTQGARVEGTPLADYTVHRTFMSVAVALSRLHVGRVGLAVSRHRAECTTIRRSNSGTTARLDTSTTALRARIPVVPITNNTVHRAGVVVAGALGFRRRAGLATMLRSSVDTGTTLGTTTA